MKTLLVEDSPSDVRLIREMLKEMPVSTLYIEHEARLDEAQGRLRQETFDAVLLDLGLPDSQGLETLMRLQEVSGGVPIVVLTSLDDEIFALEAVRAGAQDYLVKGRLNAELLIRTIRHAVERKRAAEEIRLLNAELELRVAVRTGELRRKEAELSEAQHIARVGNWYWDAKTDVTGASDELLKIFGFDPASQSLPDFREQKGQCYPAEDWERVNAAVQETLRTGLGYDLDVQATCAGAPIWVKTRGEAVHDADGHVVGLRGTVQDITERKKVEEELRHSREWLRVTLASIGDAVIAGDSETRIAFMNSAATALTGWTEEEALGQPIRRVFNLIDERTHQPVEAPCLRALKEKRTVTLDNYAVLIAKDGREIPIEDSAAPILDAARNAAGVVLVFHDVTEQRSAQRTLQKSHGELEIRVQERTAELTSSMNLLEAERKRFKDVLDQLPAYLVLLTKDYHVPFANRYFEERFGKSNGKRCYEYLFQRTEPCENCETYKVMETGAPHRWEWTGPDGRDYDIYDFPFTDVDGSNLIMEVGLDITERNKVEAEIEKYRHHLEELVQERTAQIEAANQQLQEEIAERRQAQEALRASRMAALNLAEDAVEARGQIEQANMALRESQADLNRAQIVGNIGSWRLDIRRNELRWSDQNHQIFGISKGTPLTYEAFLGTVHPEDRAYVDEKWQAALQGKSYDIEHRIVREGAVRWVCERAELEFDAQGELLGGFGTTQDITERKRAQEALRLSEERLRLALQAGRLATWDWQVATGETNWNDDLYRMLGYEIGAIEPSLEAWLGRIHADDRETTEAAFLAAMNEGAEFNGEYRACWPDGTVRWLWALGGFERNAAGQPVRSYGVLFDITEQKEAKLYIQELNEALQEHLATIETVNKDLQSYSHSVSHDLRTPLRFMNRIAYMLLNDTRTPLPESAAQQVDMILQSTAEMEELIQNLLEFAEIGRRPMKKRRVDLRRLFQEAAKELALEGRKVEIAIQEMAPCQGDRILLKEVAGNLMDNALKFTRLRERARITVGCEDTKGETVYFVQDNGVGFDMSDADALFVPFRSLHDRADFDGTGIGLAHVKRIIERHGGRIWAVSELDKGATFYFTLDKETVDNT